MNFIDMCYTVTYSEWGVGILSLASEINAVIGSISSELAAQSITLDKLAVSKVGDTEDWITSTTLACQT